MTEEENKHVKGIIKKEWEAVKARDPGWVKHIFEEVEEGKLEDQDMLVRVPWNQGFGESETIGNNKENDWKKISTMPSKIKISYKYCYNCT